MLRLAILVLLAVLAVPAHASAQWYVSFYLGATHTASSDVTIDLPAQNTSLTFEDVAFEGKPWSSPQYYGYRVGNFFGETKRFGLEVELIHIKAIAKATETYRVTGTEADAPVSETSRMDTRVQRYEMSHGLNFLVANFVARRPLGGGDRFWLVGRAGIGPVLPHAETSIYGVTQEQYEYAGFGIHLSGGASIRLGGRFSAIGEYKWTLGRPGIDVDGGTGRTTTVTHHVAMGLAFALTR